MVLRYRRATKPWSMPPFRTVLQAHQRMLNGLFSLFPPHLSMFSSKILEIRRASWRFRAVEVGFPLCQSSWYNGWQIYFKDGELLDLIDEFSEGKVQFAYVKVRDPNTGLPKNVLIAWCGEGVPERTKGYFTSHLSAVSKFLHVCRPQNSSY